MCVKRRAVSLGIEGDGRKRGTCLCIILRLGGNIAKPYVVASAIDCVKICCSLLYTLTFLYPVIGGLRILGSLIARAESKASLFSLFLYSILKLSLFRFNITNVTTWCFLW